MPKLSSEKQLEEFRRQQVELAKKIKLAEQKARIKKQAIHQKRVDLAGAVLIHQIDTEPESPLTQTLLDLLDAALTRPADRAFFAALPLVSSDQKQQEPQSTEPEADTR